MRTVLITGGSRGIGAACVRRFVESGDSVYFFYRSNDAAAEQLSAQTGAVAVKCDVSDKTAVATAFETLPKVDVLVNNAGVSLVKQIQDVTYEEYNALMSINMGGAFLCAREAAKGMIDRQSGLIVNISSVWGEVGGSCESVYSASKAALLGFTKSLAKELGYSGIRVNAISPGVIDTPMNACFSEDEMRSIQEEIPMRRLGTGTDVAKAVLFLDENDYITGIDLPVNGGFSIV
jgi:3-oxoacyl-[acyl-carrier protein] reductase